MKIIIAIDDVCPKLGYRITNEQASVWLQQLNKEFGAKFTLFVPSNYHGDYPLSHYLSWVDSLLTVPYFEVAAHGHYHDTSDRLKYGECEFGVLNGIDARERLNELFIEWMSCQYIPKGWRSPGWLTTEEASQVIGDNFSYVAAHREHNVGLNWGKAKVLYGHDGIHQENINVEEGNVIMFQSHIAGKHNHNVWNEENFQHLWQSLDFLRMNYECEFKTMQEI